MLNKQDIINIMTEQQLSGGDYWITAGAGLVMHGIKTETRDIDIGCTTRLAELLISSGAKYRVLETGERKIVINDLIEVFENWLVDDIMEIDGLCVASIQSIRKQKVELDRQKDWDDIKLIDEYIEKKYMFRIAILQNAVGLPLPTYQSAGAAGMDICAAINGDLIIPPRERVLVPTGLVIALPPDCEAQIRPRSGLALKHGITVLNAPGTIDADYRGEVSVLLINHGKESYTVKRGDRIAQMVVHKFERVEWIEVEGISRDETLRGAGGYGSTKN